MTDTLSQLASAPDGSTLLAMLNEVGEVHLLGVDLNDECVPIDAVSVAPAVSWLTSIDGDYAEGPGRVQGVFGQQTVPWTGEGSPYEIEVWLFHKSRVTSQGGTIPAMIERRVFSSIGPVPPEQWSLTQFFDANEQPLPADNDYINRLLFYSDVSGELFVGHTVWQYDPGDPAAVDGLVFRRFLTNDGQAPSVQNPLLAHRVLREDDDGTLWAQRSISEGTPSEMHVEHALALWRDDPGDGSGGYVMAIPQEEELFKTPLIKSGWTSRDAAFLLSRPHRPWVWQWDPP